MTIDDFINWRNSLATPHPRPRTIIGGINYDSVRWGTSKYWISFNYDLGKPDTLRVSLDEIEFGGLLNDHPKYPQLVAAVRLYYFGPSIAYADLTLGEFVQKVLGDP